eukprot:GHVU01157688.1.p1 GENE.GHVU01157688.1~~GHVU01157688.1.p1  ORF type:complete len:226 (+),score=41.01 GHVU01157688.1:261-938(+)
MADKFRTMSWALPTFGNRVEQPNAGESAGLPPGETAAREGDDRSAPGGMAITGSNITTNVSQPGEEDTASPGGGSLAASSVAASVAAAARPKPRPGEGGAAGHSQARFMELSAADRRGPGSDEGPPRMITLDELSRHSTAADAWVAVRGDVFDISHYLDFHPGGVEVMLPVLGTDATKAFDESHRWVSAAAILQHVRVGTVQPPPPGSSPAGHRRGGSSQLLCPP